jgi:anti-sigma regulatory factor (Ser/Thr protein kinase)
VKAGSGVIAEWHTEPMVKHSAFDDASNCFHHATLFYEGENGFLDGTLPFITEAVAAEEPILVAVPAGKVDLLRQALGRETATIHFADMQTLGSNPARIIPAWRRFLSEHASDGRPVRGIGEPIWAGRSAAELSECKRHEALLNVAFDGGQAWRLLCPYDLDALDEHVIAAAHCSHPFVAREHANAANETYLQAHQAAGPFDGELPEPAGAAHHLRFSSEDLTSVRGFVSSAAANASLEDGRIADLVLAVNELATNSLRHGGGSGALRLWTDDQTLMCEVQDAGHITEPLAGRIPPRPEQRTGRGLWVVNSLCDLVQIRSSAAGTVVRVHMRLP